jgi:hypothetical protein
MKIIVVILYVLNAVVSSTVGVAFTAGLAATGLSYFWGDPYLSRFVTSVGPGPVMSVLMPLASLVGLLPVFMAAFADALDFFFPSDMKKARPAIVFFASCLVIYHVVATIILVHLRSPGLSMKPWVIELVGWLNNKGNPFAYWIVRPLVSLSTYASGSRGDVGHRWTTAILALAVAFVVHRVTERLARFA